MLTSFYLANINSNLNLSFKLPVKCKGDLHRCQPYFSDIQNPVREAYNHFEYRLAEMIFL